MVKYPALQKNTGVDPISWFLLERGMLFCSFNCLLGINAALSFTQMEKQLQAWNALSLPYPLWGCSPLQQVNSSCSGCSSTIGLVTIQTQAGFFFSQKQLHSSLQKLSLQQDYVKTMAPEQEAIFNLILNYIWCFWLNWALDSPEGCAVKLKLLSCPWWLSHCHLLATVQQG